MWTSSQTFLISKSATSSLISQTSLLTGTLSVSWGKVKGTLVNIFTNLVLRGASGLPCNLLAQGRIVHHLQKFRRSMYIFTNLSWASKLFLVQLFPRVKVSSSLCLRERIKRGHVTLSKPLPWHWFHRSLLCCPLLPCSRFQPEITTIEVWTSSTT